MGIKNLNKRLVEVGKIKIGGHGDLRKGKGNKPDYRLPVKFDHFKVTGMDKDGNDNFIPDPEITKLLGDKPKALDILLLSDNIDNNFMTSYAMYKGKKCACRGDGEIATRRYTVDQKTKKELDKPVYKEIECNTETCPFFNAEKPLCKPNGILTCMLPQTNKVGGVHKFRTTSWNSVINITSSLEAIKLITGGVLFGIPLKMELIEKQTEDHGKVKVVNIVYAGSMQKLQIESGRQKQLRIDGSVSMIEQDKIIKTSGIMEDHDNPAEVEDEYYTEPEPEPERKIVPKKKKGTSSKDLGDKLDNKETGSEPKTGDKTDNESVENTGTKDGPGLF